MARMETRGRRDHGQGAPDYRFVAVAAVVAIIAIALSLAMGVPIPPDAGMLIAP
jgi:hypothetical protein